MGDLSHEQSMEEILSSIKRIIAEDSEAALSPPRPKRAVGGTAVAPVSTPEPEVLELTDAAPLEAEPVAEVHPEVQPPPAPSPIAPSPEAVASPRPKPVTPASPRPHPMPVESPKPVLVSEDTVSASRTAIAALSALVVKPEVAGSDTLEGLVRDMLKPMLTEWLDANLPDVVEGLVALEIRRITERDA